MNTRWIGIKLSCFASMLSIIAATSFADTHYVDINCATPVSPYTNWTTAAKIIQDAVDVASAGDLVIVTNGVYSTGKRAVYGSMANRVVIDKPITVQSVNGSSVTKIVGEGRLGSGAVRCAYLGTNTFLAGFTLTNGATCMYGDESKEQSGGGVWCEVGGVLSNCWVVGNSARISGGGVAFGKLSTCILTGNSASDGGGAYKCTLNDCTLSGNSAYRYGGGAYQGTLSNCTLSSNSVSDYYGGGAYQSTLNNCTLSGNSAPNGGGTYEGVVNNCALSKNAATQNGGGAYYGTLINCKLTGNSASSNGGGAYRGSLTNCTLSGNIAYDGGGAWQGTLGNCTLYSNSAYQNGGGAWQGTLNNCTLTGNSASQTGGGAYYGALKWCIVYYNSARINPNWSGSSMRDCCTTPNPRDDGSFTNEPCFVSAAHIATNSPCVGKGSSTYISGMDIDGETWRAPPSIGADEPYGASATGGLSVAISATYTKVIVGFQVSFTALIDGRVTHSSWDFGDGTGETNRPYVSHAWSMPGSYAVVLTARNADYPTGVTCMSEIVVVERPITYVNVSNATPAYPYAGWETAATNIQEAIIADSTAGRLILVADGVYKFGGATVYGTMTNRVALTSALTVRSVNGPQRTIIMGNGPIGGAAIRCAYVGKNCVLAGFTLTNGATRASGDWDKDRSGGGVWCEVGGVVSNCWIVGNSADCYGGGATYGTLNNCTLSGNSANGGGGTYYGTLNNCMLSGNSARTGGGAYYSDLNNCTIFGNFASSSGGGTQQGSLSNCTVSRNSASQNGGGSYCDKMKNCSISDNRAFEYGGGTYGGRLDNCTLIGNFAYYDGGGAYNGILNNCTVCGNSANLNAGGVVGCMLNNSIVYYNTAPANPNYLAGCIMEYCCTTPDPGGSSNITVNPHLATITHIATDSPCVGRGSVEYVSGVDVDGEAWGTPPSIGADEPYAGAATGGLTVSIGTAGTSVTTNSALLFTALIDGIASRSTWAFGDTPVITNQPYASHAWGATGTYAVVLTAYNDDNQGGVACTTVVHVVERVVRELDASTHCVDINCATPVHPYTNWLTAANVLQDAIDAADPGDTVLVADGIYSAGGRAVHGTLTNRVAIAKPVTVLSVNGPSATFIVGRRPVGLGAVRCAYVANGAALVGFTLTNGATRLLGNVYSEVIGGGAYCEESGQLQRCVIAGNEANQGGGGVYSGKLSDCTLAGNKAESGGGAYASDLKRCDLSNNRATLRGGGAFGGTLDNCTVAYNSASEGGGAWHCTLNGSVLAGNSASSYGGGAFESSLNHCTVTGNSAFFGGGAHSSSLWNSIIYFNSGRKWPNCSGCSTFYCCTTPDYANSTGADPGGTGNITVDPRLSSLSHISSQSPCVGAGSPYGGEMDEDIDGQLWSVPPSIGADEPYAGAATGGLTVSIGTAVTSVTTNSALLFTALIDGIATRSTWTFGDSTCIENQPYVSHAWGTTGTYAVVLTAYNDDYPGGVACTTLVHVVERLVREVDAYTHCVDINCATPVHPYTNWLTAANVLQDAIDAADPGDTVLVSDGIYSTGGRALHGNLTNLVTIAKPITVLSVNGPSSTFIVGRGPVGPGAVRCAYVTNGAALVGFTLTNGATTLLAGWYREALGGGAYCEESGQLQRCVIAGNKANLGGGGVYSGMLSDCIIAGNEAGYGGGVYSGKLSDCALAGNKAGSGGGAYASDLKRCDLSNNRATYQGGGADESTLDNCTVAYNSATEGGGAGFCTLNGCVLAGNFASSYGGGAFRGILYHCTVTGNSAFSGGGAHSSGLVSSIIYFNSGRKFPNCSGCGTSYCCTTPDYANSTGGDPGGIGNITVDPLLVSLSHISPQSPCVGAGTLYGLAGEMEMDEDIDGQLWSAPPSIGADEPYAGATTGGLSVRIGTEVTSVTTNSALLFTALIDGMATRSTWVFGDTPVITNQPYASHAWGATGSYAVVLTAYNDDHPGGVACTTLVHVVEKLVREIDASTHCVDINCATPVHPYTNWLTAANVIQDAVDAADPGDTVLVADGIYSAGGRALHGTLTNRVTIAKPITVLSVNGPSATFIVGRGPIGPGAVRCAYVTNGAALVGFTLTNGATRMYANVYSERDGGGAYCEESGQLQRCVIAGNEANQGGGGVYRGKLIDCKLAGNKAEIGGGAYVSDLKRCDLSHNRATYRGGGVYGSTLNNCTVAGNSAREGGGASSCTFNGCVLAGNSASSNGGGALESTLIHCTVTGNSAYAGGGAYSSSLWNSIIYFNSGRKRPNCAECSTSLCCIPPDYLNSTGMDIGGGYITVDPRLVSLSHISPQSPCVGAGTPYRGSYGGEMDEDIDGQLWSEPPSIGADEPYAGAAAGGLSVRVGTAFTSVTTDLSIPFTALIDGNATRSTWTFGDSTCIENQPYTSHAWGATGTYAVVLTAYNDDHPGGVASTTLVHVVEQPVHYVNGTNAAPCSPYTSWATAATNIQDAVSAGQTQGRLILVADGVYESGGLAVNGAMTNRVALTDRVTVRSVNGPHATIIQGQSGPFSTCGEGAVRCAYVGNGATLSGFTLTNGWTRVDYVFEQSCGGGVWNENGGHVFNCIIVGNNAYINGGGVYGGTLSNCWLSCNTATESGGGCYEGSVFNCQLMGNHAKLGGGAADSALYGCTVVSNLAEVAGGVSGGSCRNSIVYFNSNGYWAEDLGGGIHVEYSCTPNFSGVDGCISEDPLLSIAADGSFRLRCSSPCINKGINESWMMGSRDLAGSPRIQHGMVDMGAYEFGFAADLKGMLQGSYSTSTHTMVTSISTNLPTKSPFAADVRMVASVPSNTVDWALVEVLDTNRNTLASMSVFLDPQGRVTDETGSTTIPVEVSAGSYYLALRHRNHLSAMSAQPVAFTNTVVSYDFSTGADKYFGGTNACVELEPGVWGLRAGDADGDGRITPVDREIVRRQKGMKGYLQGDLNLDGKVDGGDQ